MAPLARAAEGLSFRNMAIDPVCGMEIEESQAPASTEFEGRPYYFCSESCRDEFEANPSLYALDIGTSPNA
jgi:YHS domain-containing protein